MPTTYRQKSAANRINVVGVVVVDVAIVVHIPEIRGVARIRWTQPPIVCRKLNGKRENNPRKTQAMRINSIQPKYYKY